MTQPGPPIEPHSLIEAWVEAELERNPVSATRLGAHGYDGELGDFSAARWRAEPQLDRRSAGRLAELTPAETTSAETTLDQRIDVALVLSELSARSVMEDWEAWRRDPAIYLDACTDGVFSLLLHRILPEPHLAAATTSRLRQVEGVLGHARANLDADLASPLLVRRALDACRPAAQYFRELVPAQIADARLRSLVAAAGEHAAAALDDFATHLDDLAGRAKGNWAIGEERYSALLKDRELLGYGASELSRRGAAAWAEIDTQMAELARSIDPSETAWLPVVMALCQDHPATPLEMRTAYEHACSHARRFLEERELVSFAAGERCVVEESPPFQRPLLAVASYEQAPPLSHSRTGHFFVPYPPEGASAEEVAERLADNSFHVVPTVAVHEAYPGHHWQLSWSASTTSRVRHLLTSPYFVEGWALYAEKMMRDHGYFSDPRAELMHLDMRIFRAARVVVDPALHAGEMTVEEATGFLMNKAGLTRAVAMAEAERYCAWPTQAPSYLMGSLEIERAAQRWASHKRGGLREFHDSLAASPGLPLPLAELSAFGETSDGSGPGRS